ncbi:MalY/PatB family protein [Jeotgalibacillus sp. R-1-5s-1]|uniref:MalY/PatB family protein n=1 Tax=Jeotgalibacillus sp. R-1-5s-1 TaxID=2555897 RepID=UPI001ABCD935|nr:PatB family C-S lyase [Jeotgalibacillus sp. R-1-5s-1]
MIDFDRETQRTGSHSVKWDMMNELFGKSDLLPMWVADMDFAPPESVMTSLTKRLEQPPYGYTFVPPSTARTIAGWLEKRHGWKTNASWYLYSIGVVPSIATAIRALTAPGDHILTMTPVYTPFFGMIEQNGRTVVTNHLIEQNGRYEIDWEDLSQKLSDVKMFLLCSPHNPSGRVWSSDELKRLSDLCAEHDVVLVSDEIHSDLIYRHARHVPTAKAAGDEHDHIITLVAPSKTFNLAGLQASAIICSNEETREKIKEEQGRQGFFTLSTFGITAMEAAYSEGEEWLESLIDYLTGNLELVRNTVTEMDQINMMEPDSTYLLWLDARKTGLSDEEIKKKLVDEAGLALEPGDKYGKGGEGFIRMNIACPRSMVEEGLRRLQMVFK